MRYAVCTLEDEDPGPAEDLKWHLVMETDDRDEAVRRARQLHDNSTTVGIFDGVDGGMVRWNQ